MSVDVCVGVCLYAHIQTHLGFLQPQLPEVEQPGRDWAQCGALTASLPWKGRTTLLPAHCLRGRLFPPTLAHAGCSYFVKLCQRVRR